MELLARGFQSALLAFILLLAVSAEASHHSWRFSEAYSNTDGTLQFVEMVSNADGHDKITCCRVVAGNKMTGVDTPYSFPQNLPTSSTNGKSMLLATATFEATYGITPDYIIPDNFLTVTSGDVFYNDTLSWDNLPTDGVNSLQKIGGQLVEQAATPQNFSGDEITIVGSSDAEPPVLANLPSETSEILSNTAVSANDSRITSVLDSVTCSDNEDDSPSITFETPDSFPVGEVTTVTAFCSDDSSNTAQSDILFSVVGFLDTDGDGIGDDEDSDDDGDGVPDVDDDLPLDSSESVDTDQDGIGNNSDTDDDGDGVLDSLDAFPLDADESLDTDSDGTGNNADTDDDNDGTPDTEDDLPLDESETLDTDNDGIGNNADSDDDNDGILDEDDTNPLTPDSDIDTDGDGLQDSIDNCPNSSNADQTDLDNDGQGDVCDEDDDGDGINDLDDDFPQDGNESIDSDNDGVGNNSDTDDDDDGIPDEVEEANGLDPLSAADAEQDKDGDGLSNLSEFQMGKDISTDDVPPVITLDSPVQFNATGRRTRVVLDSVTASDAKDGELTPTPNSDGVFEPGTHKVTWTAADEAGNVATSEQIVEVLPLVTLQADQIVAEGDQVNVAIALNGSAPSYPVTVTYEITGSASVNDFSQLSGSKVISSDVASDITFNTTPDDVPEGDETIMLSITEVVGATIGSRSATTITISEENLPPVVWLQVVQANEQRITVSQGGGVVTVTALASDPNLDDTLSYDWTESDETLEISNVEAASVTFDPSGISPGTYYLMVSVSDDAPNPASVQRTQSVTIVDEFPSLSTSADSDGDGVADATEGFDDPDYDGIPAYLDNSSDTTVLLNSNDRFLETEPGIRIRLGEAALAEGSFSPSISNDDVTSWAESLPMEAANPVDDQFVLYDQLFDFELDRLSNPGQSVQIVLPLEGGVAPNAVYRKYSESAGWQTFTEDSTNQIASTTNNLCPPPNDSSYEIGLPAGANCLRLTIQDGGPNDRDGLANARILDPGAIAVADTTPPTITAPSSITIESSEDITEENPEIIDFLASASCEDELSGERDVTNDAPSSYLVGSSTTINFSCSDAAGNNASSNASVSISEPPAAISPTGSSSGTGCFIATAAYGSWLAPEVETLRNFRDRYLITNEPGRWFVASYYEYSPPVAKVIESSATLASLTRVALSPVVYAVKFPSLAFLVFLSGIFFISFIWRNVRK